MAFQEDLALFLDTAEFAVTATATPAGGDQVQFQVIFDRPYAQGLADLMAASQPQAIARSADVDHLPVGTPITIDGVNWLLAQPPQPDGTGITRILLELAV